METLEVVLILPFHYALARYVSLCLMCLNKLIGTREWNVIVCIFLVEGEKL